ncbi:hypothetical protein AHAS_Ahas06G0236000 [Arachis hypogaea]
MAKDFNYPAIAAEIEPMKPFKINFTRIVTNVGFANSTYKACFQQHSGINITIVPNIHKFKCLKEKQAFVVNVVGGKFSEYSVVSWSLLWSDGTHSVRCPIIRAGALNIKVLSTTLGKVEFNVTALGDPAKDRRVEVDRSKNLFSCSCKLFESRGIPCSHVLCAMKFENILEFSDSLIYKRWTKNAKNEFFSIEMPVHDDVERVLKFRVGALASNCNKLCDIACKDLADFDEVQFELLNLVIRLQSRKQGKSTPNVNVEGINDPFVVKSKGAPSKRSSWRKKRACFNCHKYGHYYKRCPDLMQHSVQGNPRNRSDGNASAKDSGFSPERFANSSRSFSVKSEHHSGPKTKPFKKGGTRKFTAKGMRNQKGKDNTFDEVIFVNINL